jgi:nucleotide-binding universal stress UspA family protein
VNQQALGLALTDLLPPGAKIVKGPSYYMAERKVKVEIDLEGDVTPLEEAYQARTGFQLTIVRSGEPLPTPPALPDAPVVAAGDRPQMEINAAYDVIRQALGQHGLYKTSLKQGQIVLAFISPQVGARHQATIQKLAEQTGYSLSIHPHPNQQQILQVAQQVLRDAGWTVRKGPGLRVDQGELVVSLAGDPTPAQINEVSDALA